MLASWDYMFAFCQSKTKLLAVEQTSADDQAKSKINKHLEKNAWFWMQVRGLNNIKKLGTIIGWYDLKHSLFFFLI